MADLLVIGAGPAGLLAAWVASQRGVKVRLLATGIGTTHVMPGWLGVLDTPDELPAALSRWCQTHPSHPYARTGAEAVTAGIEALRAVAATGGLRYVGDMARNMRLPTALGAVMPAALAPESMAAGDLTRPGALLIAGPAGWRDFYPQLCAETLTRQGYPARAVTFDLPALSAGHFDATSAGVARLFEAAEIRAQVAEQLQPHVAGVSRVGMPAVLGVERHPEVWRDLQERLGVDLFEIPTLPPSVPGMRLYNTFKRALARAGVQILLDMTAVRGVPEVGGRVTVTTIAAVRELTHRADAVILATGGLYGGGISSSSSGKLAETVFGLPVSAPAPPGEWFASDLLSPGGHRIHQAGIRADQRLRPVDGDGRVVTPHVHLAGRILAGYDPVTEGSTEGVWLATACRAAHVALDEIS